MPRFAIDRPLGEVNLLPSQLIAGFGLFVISLIVLTILTGIVARMVRGSALSPIDRTLGFIFGLVRGAFLVCLAYLLLDQLLQPNDRPGWGTTGEKRSLICAKGRTVLRTFLPPESIKIKQRQCRRGGGAGGPAPRSRRSARCGHWRRQAPRACRSRSPRRPRPTGLASAATSTG